MRIDKFTTRFQQAFADAQSLAVGNDNPYIEPQHLLLALLNQDDGGTASLLVARRGQRRRAARGARNRPSTACPKVEGTGGEVNVSRELANLLNLTDKEAQKRGDQFIASELFLLAADAGQGRDRPAAQAARRRPAGARAGDRGRARRRNASRTRKPRASARRSRNTRSI